MKLRPMSVSSQLLVILMAALVLIFMMQLAQAQTSTTYQQSNVIQSDMNQKARMGDRILQNTTLSYYQQLLGPTVAGAGGETYNVFQEAKTPYQSFHAASLRYQINPSWTVGTSLAVATAYGDTQTATSNGFKSKQTRDEFFNARLFVVIPALQTTIGTLFTTVSYEAPTSNVSRTDEMRYGLVLTQSFAFKLPSIRWTGGIMGQYYRAYFKENVKTTYTPENALFPGSYPYTTTNERQTTIANIGPYVGYRFNDKWMATSSLTFDWDQRGNKTSTTSFNNNLPDRARAGVTYFPGIKYFASVGIFTQALLKYTTDTHALGAEMALKF